MTSLSLSLSLSLNIMSYLRKDKVREVGEEDVGTSM
jgi:hypothetical protein